MEIIVLSCSLNEDIFYPFHHCLEKYWPDHPKVNYFTDGIINPYYFTIPSQHDLNNWTSGVRYFLQNVEADKVLLMIDDCFIRRPVDTARIKYAEKHLGGNIALMNFEKSWDEKDIPTELDGWKKRRHGSAYEVSLMCGLWQKDKLLKVLGRNCDPWTIELEQDNCGFDYYINSGDYIIDWGYRTFQPCNLIKGKWAAEVVDFFDAEGIKIDYNKRGFN